MVLSRLKPAIKWHGGKWYLANKIVDLMPGHTHYVEPYAGGLSVLLAKSPVDVSEVVNDLNGELTNFWRVLQRTELFTSFQRILECVPFSEREWRDAANVCGDDPVDRAVAFFIRCRQSLAGRMDCFAPLSRNRIRRGMNEQASAWLGAIEGLPLVHERLKSVVILNQEATSVIMQQDGPETLFYLDPPYLKSTRTSGDVYDYEMSDSQHEELLSTIQECSGKIILSGYTSELYTSRLRNWNQHSFQIPNQASGSKTKRTMTEVVWTNF